MNNVRMVAVALASSNNNHSSWTTLDSWIRRDKDSHRNILPSQHTPRVLQFESFLQNNPSGWTRFAVALGMVLALVVTLVVLRFLIVLLIELFVLQNSERVKRKIADVYQYWFVSPFCSSSGAQSSSLNYTITTTSSSTNNLVFNNLERIEENGSRTPAIDPLGNSVQDHDYLEILLQGRICTEQDFQKLNAFSNGISTGCFNDTPKDCTTNTITTTSHTAIHDCITSGVESTHTTVTDEILTNDDMKMKENQCTNITSLCPTPVTTDLHTTASLYECSICLNEINVGDWIYTASVCQHTFHSQCILGWTTTTSIPCRSINHPTRTRHTMNATDTNQIHLNTSDVPIQHNDSALINTNIDHHLHQHQLTIPRSVLRNRLCPNCRSALFPCSQPLS